jgi:capsular polysaccharide biosynthesis protein
VLKERVEAETGMELDATIRATLLPDTNLLDLKVTADEPEKAFFIIRSLIENHGIITSKVMENAVLQVLKAPRVPTVPDVALDNYDVAQKAALIAVAIAACIVGIVSYFSDTLKNTQEAEHKIGAQLLGAIYHERKYKTLRAHTGEKQGLLITDPSVGFRFVESYKNCVYA